MIITFKNLISALGRTYRGNQQERVCQELVEVCRGWETLYKSTDVGCKGFAGRSLSKVLIGWATKEQPRREPFNLPVRLQRKPLDGFQWKGPISGQLLGCRLGPIAPGWVAWARVYVVRPKTLYDPRSQHWWCTPAHPWRCFLNTYVFWPKYQNIKRPVLARWLWNRTELRRHGGRIG